MYARQSVNGWSFTLGMVVACLVMLVSRVEAGTLYATLNADPPSLDPTRHFDLNSANVLNQLYEGLTASAADGTLVPALATRWEAFDGGRGWRFHLRPGVIFHSGRPFTAGDVKSTFEALLTKGRQGSIEATELLAVIGAHEVMDGRTDELAGVTIVDDHTIEIRFAEPEVLFPFYRFYIVDRGMEAEHGAGWFDRVSGGTGPFRLGRWQRGSGIDLPPFPDHWGGPAAIDGVHFRIFSNPETALAFYDAGQIDVLAVPEAVIRWVMTDQRYADDRLVVPRAHARGVGMNQTAFLPFRDRRVREAVALVIDQEAFAEAHYPGASAVASGVVPAGLGGYRPSLPPPRYDPERAKALLAEAGYPGGQGFPPVDVVAINPIREEAAYVASQLQTILGLPVGVRIVDRGAYLKALDAREPPLFIWGWTANEIEPMYFLRLLWRSDSRFNRFGWKNPRFDALIDAALGEADTARRFPIYAEAESILIDDVATVPLPTPKNVLLRKPWARDVMLMTPFGQIQIGIGGQAFR